MVHRRAAQLDRVEFADEIALRAEHLLIVLVARKGGLTLAGLQKIRRVPADLIEKGDQRRIGLRIARRTQPDVQDRADLFVIEDDRHEKHRVRRGVADFSARRGRHPVGRQRAHNETGGDSSVFRRGRG